MGRLAGKVVFLTGGGGVLGRASSELFAREGARIAVVDARKEQAEETAQLVVAHGGEAIALCADVTDESAVRTAVEATVQHWGYLDTLFNNAGVMPHQDESVLDLDVELMARIYAINVTGTALCCKYAVPHIKRMGGGAVVNMSSFLAVMGCIKPQDAYGASKGAIVSLTRSLAVQLGGDHIRVNALCPGPIETEHVRHFFADEAARKLRLDRIPLGRFGQPEDVAELALFLASDAAKWLTGQAIMLDGGISCNYFSVL
ncbi:MAG TPA: SDR family NAD(P)-dependent oxidoreductase [Ktedonobacteraceae bacterium]|jgi:NAD(P)-dependent dehydrogenase (short-subunit alcohol dehydrogenase family)|nr:SDR family NAD(P)-dependent oxidoreductase [Ktedonobacteraceae bacterium]